MRAFVTRVGLGLLISAALMLSLALGLTAGVARLGPSSSTCQAVGPFQGEVERVVSQRDAEGRARVWVQLHLWRPGGPVPLAQRVPVRGRAALEGAFVRTDEQWLLHNEFTRYPRGATLVLPGLGGVPATSHAGEVRAVFEFVGRGPVDGFEFRLPTGETVSFAHLRVENR